VERIEVTSNTGAFFKNASYQDMIRLSASHPLIRTMEKVNETHSDDIKEEEEHAEKVRVTRKLKLDKHGIPLSPQPSDDPDDPLNWSMKLKVLCVSISSSLGAQWFHQLFTLTQVSILAALGPLNGCMRIFVNFIYLLFHPFPSNH